MTEPRIVTPQVAQEWLKIGLPSWQDRPVRLAHTVATEPDRTRAAVVKALREFGSEHVGLSDFGARSSGAEVANAAFERADAIENGADYA